MLLVAQFMANVDTAITNVAVPSVQSDLGATNGAAGLIVSAYVIAYAVLLVIGARLGATYGHRRTFVAGLIVFTAGSLACAAAPDALVLIAARVIQGIGAALMVPQVLSGIQMHFTGEQRVKALGHYAVALSGGAVAGQALGGVLIAGDVAGLGWRPIFLINAPIGVVLLLAAFRTMPEDASEGGFGDLDFRGASLLSVAVLLLVVPLQIGRDAGWPWWTFASLAASACVFALFCADARRVSARGGRPLIAPAVVRIRELRWSLAAHGATTMTYFSLLFVLALYLQDSLGHGPAYAGLAMVSWVAAFGIAGPMLAVLPERFRTRADAWGCLVLAVGYAAVAFYLIAGHRSGPALFGLLTIGGLGLGISSNALIARMTLAIPRNLATDLSGVISTNAQLSGALGVAGLGTWYQWMARNEAPSVGATALCAVTTASAAVAILSAIAAILAARSHREAVRSQDRQQGSHAQTALRSHSSAHD